MATKREYLIDLNLAKPGRGRFSREATAALEKAVAEGVVFDDGNTGKVVASASTSDAADHRRSREGAPTNYKPEPGGNWTLPKPQVRVRMVKAMYAMDPDGRECMFLHCSRCGHHVSFCNCPTIGLPWGCTVLLDRSDPLEV